MQLQTNIEAVSAEVPISVWSAPTFTPYQMNNLSDGALLSLRMLGLYTSYIGGNNDLRCGFPFDELLIPGVRPIVSLILPIFRIDDISIRQLLMIAHFNFRKLTGRHRKVGEMLVHPHADTLLFGQLPNDRSGHWRICHLSQFSGSQSLSKSEEWSLDDYTGFYLSQCREDLNISALSSLMLLIA